MSMLPSYSDISELLKKGLTFEAQEKIMELREAVLALQEDNVSLKGKISELEAALHKKTTLKHQRLLYFSDHDPIPFCPRCWEIENKAIHLFGPVPMLIKNTEYWKCHSCHYDFASQNGGPFHPTQDKRRA